MMSGEVVAQTITEACGCGASVTVPVAPDTSSTRSTGAYGHDATSTSAGVDRAMRALADWRTGHRHFVGDAEALEAAVREGQELMGQVHNDLRGEMILVRETVDRLIAVADRLAPQPDAEPAKPIPAPKAGKVKPPLVVDLPADDGEPGLYEGPAVPL